ncbi:hypothetical protein SDC9_128832 [bioreactor metagenome]|uniref:Uncharacterized protein n=1 Tax=bioreactor metagenome TaxID=1076179 RepID=A0A645CY45_9ZZZZ
MVPVNSLLVTGLFVPMAQVSLMPQPSIMVLPVTCCHWRAVPSEAAMPPACETHRGEKSSLRNCAFCSSALNSVFTAGSMWKGRFFSTSTNFGMSRGLGISVRLDPWRMASRHSVSAKMWYSGSAAMLLALLRSPILASAGVNHASACNVAAMMLRCVSTAPLDSPVVPPVYMISRSSAVRPQGASKRSAPAATMAS